jgi:Carboxypeptidase regulatory-like domain/TonB dependent receptor
MVAARLLVTLNRLIFLFLLAAIAAPCALGQASYTAQVRGVVADQSGALLQNATVTITNDGTNISSVTHTDDHGQYILTGLRPDKYTVKVEATGFQPAESKDVVLAVNQQATLNYSLKPASVLATVVVTETLPLLDTENASIGTDVTNEYVRDIPLYNRSFYGLVFLAGGVTETTGSGINDNYPSGTNFVSNGQRNATAQVTLDGSPVSAPEQGEGGNSNVYFQPSVEIVQEFKVQNNSFSAEFGNNGGTLVNIVLKQGTNKFHGSGWWYGQRSAFDARDYFNSGEKPDHLRDQYGFSVGGPIKKSKTFFFFDFEKIRLQDPFNEKGIVPTDLERTGDFSQSVNSPGGIFDPQQCTPSGNACTRTQFFDIVDGNPILNKMPAGAIDPIGQKILNLYPHETIHDAAAGDPNWRATPLSSQPQWQFDVKLDHQLNANHKLSGRYSRHHDVQTIPTVVGSGDFGPTGDGVIYTTNVHNGSLEYNWSVRPTMLWTNRFSIDRVAAPGASNNYPTLSDVGLPPILGSNGLTRMPTIQADVNLSFLSLFTQCCVDTHFAHSLYSYSSGLQWVKGRHSIKFGGEQRIFFNNFWQPNYPTGFFDVSRDVTTSQPNAGLGDSGEGSPFATILTGFAYSGQLNIVPAIANKSKETAFYVQDDWKVTPKLTINVGLRYEWSTPYSERYNRLQFSDFTGATGINIPVDRAAGFPEFGQIGNIVGTTVFPTSGHRNAGVDRNNFAPRLGFAYQLATNTVLRGGAGVFYGMNVATNFQYAGPAFQKSANINFTLDNFQTQYASLSNPFPAGLAPPQGTQYGKVAQWGFGNASDLGTQTARNAEIYQWNLGIQHLLPGQIVLGVDYSANRSTHLPWAGAGGISTRGRNFLPSSVRNALVATLNPTHDPNDNSVSDFLNAPVDNPFQCFFTTAAPPQSYCPASPIFNAIDVLDSTYVNAQIPQLNLLRSYPQFDGSFEGLPRLIATSWYNSLQIRFQKRASHYISFEGNYTLSKATDDSSSGRNAWIGNLFLDNPQVLDNLKAEHGISSNDATHRLTTAFIVDLPFGRDRWMGKGMNRILDGIVGGWSLYSFLTIQSGQPLAIIMGSPRLADGNQRPNVICSQLRSGLSYRDAARTGLPYLNQDCFADPGDNIPGNAPRHFSNLRGDGIRNIDMSLSKEFKIREDMLVQVRAEVFNLANHQRFAFPDTASGDGSFGNVTSTANNYRRMQFGARFQF